MQTIFEATPENRQKAREILERKIESGRRSAAGLLDHLANDVPNDVVVRGQATRFESGAQLGVRLGDGEVLGVDGHALGQLGQRAGVHTAYLRTLATAEEPWQRELAAHVLNEHYGHSTSRFLARSVHGELRGWLSDKYRRLDSRPLVDAFAEECGRVGAVPVDGTHNKTRVALKALIPQVYEPVPGEVMAFGVEWHNSDFGNGLHTLRAFMMRLWCLNGCTMENALSQVHIGGRLSEEFELSQRTYQLDTAASVSALRDIVRGVLAPAKVEALCLGIQRAQANDVEWRNVSSKVGKRLLKGELDAAKAAFESEDTINLPAGKTAWRASNALSWIAKSAENPERKLELERIAGELVDGRRDRALALAA